MKELDFTKYSEDAVLHCRDFTLSQDEFELRRHDDLDMLVTFPTPSAEELPKYYNSEKYISHTDSRKSLTDKIYQRVKKYMLKQKLSWLEKEVNSGRQLLDIGAGTGDFLSVAKNLGWKVSGTEPDAGARELASQKGVSLHTDSHTFASETFDVITMWHVLEHVPDLEAQINELSRLLKKDGLLVIAVPNFKSYDAHTYKEHWAAFDVPRHLWHFSRNAVKKIFSSHHFQLEKDRPLIFDSFYVSMLSEKYKGGNVIKGVFHGLVSNLIARRTKEYSSLVYFLRKSS